MTAPGTPMRARRMRANARGRLRVALAVLVAVAGLRLAYVAGMDSGYETGYRRAVAGLYAEGMIREGRGETK